MSETMNALLVNFRKTHKELTTVAMNYIQRALDTLRDDEMFYIRKELDYDGSLSEITFKMESRYILGITKESTVVLRQKSNEGNVHDGFNLEKLKNNSLVQIVELIEKVKCTSVKWAFSINKS
jgi:L-cysteine desulfidase